MFTYRKATAEEMPDLLDLANYVFSQNAVPHDFAKLLPKVYGPDAPFDEAEQFIAMRDDGRIRALIALRHMTLEMPGDALHLGFVGTVSVHPYARGEGHMKALMAHMREQAEKQQVDLLVLGGQRQRYQYFGFECGGYRYRFTVTERNIRHAMRDVDASAIAFTDLRSCTPEQLDLAHALHQKKDVRMARSRDRLVDILRSWASEACAILDGGEMIGYLAGNGMEIALTDEAMLPAVIKAMMAQRALKKITVDAAPWETARIAALSAFAESCSLVQPDMVCVLNWPRVLKALLALRGRFLPLADGVCTLAIDGQGYTIRVAGGVPTVTASAEAPDMTLTAMEAQLLLFSLSRFTAPHPRLYNWLPLPMDVPSADAF